MRYNFDWDSAKEKRNIRKHKLTFRRAATIFHDPDQLSIFDEDHSENEDRWITIGIDSGGVLRVVVHTFEQIDDKVYEIHIISARKATHSESNWYREKILKEEYDFSKSIRGKFYNPDAVFGFPVYLEPDVDDFMNKLAERQNVDVQKLVNEWLRANIRLVQSVQQPY